MHDRGRRPNEGEIEYEERDFAPTERARLRRQMREWDQCHWGWKVLWRAIVWGTATIAGLYAMRDFLWRALKAFFGAPG